jgi:RHS repeat-associated protein
LSTGYGPSYTFDYEHRLTGVGTDQFYYDGAGNRLQATRNGVTTRYVYDAAGNLLAEADGQNNITRYYIYGLGLMAMVTPADQVYCYHFNAIGSTIAMTDQNQAVVNKYAYDPFGNIANQTETTSQPFKFVGQFGVITEPNGFYYMRARFYDPIVGRFISEDPIGFDGGDVNLMAYVQNNPVNGSDPWGLLGLITPGFTNVKRESPNYKPVPDTQFYYPDPSWVRLMSVTRGNAIPGQWGSAAAFPALVVGVPLAIGAAGAVYAAPAISAFVLTHPEIPVLAGQFIQGYLPTGPPSTHAGYAGLAVRTAKDIGTNVYQNYFSGK